VSVGLICRAFVRGCAAMVLLGGSLAALAQDVWGFVDANGVAHFANERVDERYQLFFKAGQPFDTAAGVPRGTSQANGPGLDTPRQVAVPTSSQNRLLAFFDVSHEFKTIRPLMREAAQQHGIDFELVQAVIAAESGYNRQAVSPKGAVGLMQIMPATGERYGVVGDKPVTNGKPVKGARSTSDKLFDPKTNLAVGTRYLRDLMRLFPERLDLVLAAYNAGEGAVQRNGNQIPPYRETQNYVQTVMALYQALKPPVLSPQANGAPQRVRMQIGGGIPGRANMPPSAMAAQGVFNPQTRLIEVP
jgi:hypothetical protein